jgi:small-conductance mechanosensitive channel
LLVLAALPASANDTGVAPPAQVQQLLQLMNDPVVQQWAAGQHVTGATATPAAATAPASFGSGMPASMDRMLGDIRDHLIRLAEALPTLPDQVAHAQMVLVLEIQGLAVPPWLLILVFLGFGVAADLAFRILMRRAGFVRWLLTLRVETASGRLQAAAIRMCFGFAVILCFSLATVGAFLAFDWPPLLREIVTGYLAALVFIRLSLIVGRFALAPGAERFRLVPMTTMAAWFWFVRFGVFTGLASFGWVTIELLTTLGLSEPARELLFYQLGLILLLVAIEALWRHPPAAPEAEIENESAQAQGRHPRLARALLTVYFCGLWLLWVLQAEQLFWLAVVAVGLPLVTRGVSASVDHVLRSPKGEDAEEAFRSVAKVCLDRGIRTLLIVGAAMVLANAWHINFDTVALGDTLSTRLIRGALKAVVILLVAEFLWQFLRAFIDARLSGAVLGLGRTADSPEALADKARRDARLRTLLPILRNILFVVIFVISALMVLSSMGIEIAPLIAGAGVVGVAVGFGAQTLVKDVISGVFFLLDDAFRVGEYIQSGSYKGTVEAFSLRSIKLRHHRGPLYTVPFGELGAVQNMSRDWVIEKMMFGVTYDTDLEKARKIIKQVGLDLAADPEFAPHIIEPLKMQGVEQFGDYAIQIRVKMTTKPGEQFTIRRKALAMIKEAFSRNGIQFAFPTVQIASGPSATGEQDAATLAVAKTSLDINAIHANEAGSAA